MDIRKYITKKNVIIGAVAGTAIIGGIFIDNRMIVVYNPY